MAPLRCQNNTTASATVTLRAPYESYPSTRLLTSPQSSQSSTSASWSCVQLVAGGSRHGGSSAFAYQRNVLLVQPGRLSDDACTAACSGALNTESLHAAQTGAVHCPNPNPQLTPPFLLPRVRSTLLAPAQTCSSLGSFRCPAGRHHESSDHGHKIAPGIKYIRE